MQKAIASPTADLKCKVSWGGSLKLARKREHKTLPIAPRPLRLQFEEHRLEALPLWNQVADD